MMRQKTNGPARRRRFGVVAVCSGLRVATVLSFMSAAPALAASFDCVHIHNKIDFAICGTPELSRLDDQVAAAFAAVPQSRAQVVEQRKWMFERNRLCRDDVECLTRSFRDRLAALEAQGRQAETEAKARAEAQASAENEARQKAADDARRRAAEDAAAKARAVAEASAHPPPPPPPPVDFVNLPDRTVFESRFDCGLKSGLADLVILGPPDRANEAYFILRADPTIRSAAYAGHMLYRYALARDDTLGLFRLTAPTVLYQDDTPTPERVFELVREPDGETLTGHFGACQIMSMKKRKYLKSTGEMLAAAKSPNAGPPTLTLARALGPPEFCIILSAWAERLKAEMPDVDYRHLSMADSKQSIFRASIFHPAFAQAYAGTDYTASRSLSPVISAMLDCTTDPASFENATVIDRVFVQGINQSGLPQAMQSLREIADRVMLVARAGDKFSLDADGLAKLNSYVEPIERELALAVPPTRDAILAPIARRETEIAVAILRDAAGAGSAAMSFERVALLNAAIGIAKGHPDLVPDSAAIVVRAEAAVRSGLKTSVAADLAPIAAAPATLDGLVGLNGRLAAARAKYASVISYPEFQDSANEATARLTALDRDVAASLRGQIASARAASDIVSIREKLDAFEKTKPPADLSGPLSAAYSQGLTDWFRAAVAAAPRSSNAVPPGANEVGKAPGAFGSPSLKERTIVSAIYLRDFRPLYRDKAKTEFYIEHILTVLSPNCPGNLSGDAMRSILKRRVSPDILTDPQKAGQDVLMNMLKELANLSRDPGGWMDRQIDQGELASRAEADARIILTSTACDSREMATFFANIEAWLADPSMGVPTAEQDMADICRHAMPETEADYRREKYCSCVGPVFSGALDQTQQSFARIAPRPNFWDVLRLVPGLREAAGRCAL